MNKESVVMTKEEYKRRWSKSPCSVCHKVFFCDVRHKERVMWGNEIRSNKWFTYCEKPGKKEV